MNECFIGGTSGAGLAREAAPAQDSGGTYASPKCPWMHPGSRYLSASLFIHSFCVQECVEINDTPLSFGRKWRHSQDFRVYFLLLIVLHMIWMAVPQASQ